MSTFPFIDRVFVVSLFLVGDKETKDAMPSLVARRLGAVLCTLMAVTVYLSANRETPLPLTGDPLSANSLQSQSHVTWARSNPVYPVIELVFGEHFEGERVNETNKARRKYPVTEQRWQHFRQRLSQMVALLVDTLCLPRESVRCGPLCNEYCGSMTAIRTMPPHSRVTGRDARSLLVMLLLLKHAVGIEHAESFTRDPHCTQWRNESQRNNDCLSDATNKDCTTLHEAVSTWAEAFLSEISRNTALPPKTHFRTHILPAMLLVARQHRNNAVDTLHSRMARQSSALTSGECSNTPMNALTIDEHHLLSLLIDLEISISFVVEKMLGRPYSQSFPGGVLCMVPKVRSIVTFGKNHHWLFASRAMLSSWITNSSLVIDTERELSAQHEVESREFAHSCSIGSSKGLSKSARAKAIYYNLTALIVPATPRSAPHEVDGTLSSNVLRGHAGTFRKRQELSYLRDERFIRIRDIQVTPTDVTPRFVVGRELPLYLMPLIFDSHNVGHVMFRYYSAVDLLQHHLHWMDERGARALFGYIITPSSLKTFSPSKNKYRLFNEAVGSAGWFSIASFEEFPESKMTSVDRQRADNPRLDISFQRAAVGFGAVYMFHPRHIEGLEKTRLKSQRALQGALWTLRNATLRCFDINEPLQSSTLPGASERHRVRITIISRKKRQLLNVDELLRDFLSTKSATSSLHVSSAARVNVSYFDNSLKQEVQLVVVDFEDLSLKDQIRLVHDETDILLGVAGSGLCWMMFMQPGSVVVEVQDPPIMKCTGEGINKERLFCDFSKQSAATRLHHIGVRAKRSQHCNASALQCDVVLSLEAFSGTIAAALCSLGRTEPEDASAECSKYLV